MQNLDEVQPTHFASVPRFYEKVLTSAATADPAETGRRLRRVFGPRIDWMSSGGAPLPPAVAEAYHDGRPAGAARLRPDRNVAGHLVQPQGRITSSTRWAGRCRASRCSIAADGEVLTRGPHVMKGYWNDPEATAEAIRDGWLHTGDLGELDADGFLRITGRKKDLLVLSNGKKVVPSYVEGLLLADPCIDQAVVCGEGRNFLTALLVPPWDNVRARAAAGGRRAGGRAGGVGEAAGGARSAGAAGAGGAGRRVARGTGEEVSDPARGRSAWRPTS